MITFSVIFEGLIIAQFAHTLPYYFKQFFLMLAYIGLFMVALEYGTQCKLTLKRQKVAKVSPDLTLILLAVRQCF